MIWSITITTMPESTHLPKQNDTKSFQVEPTTQQKGATQQFIDNRPIASAQRGIQLMANNSAQVKHLQSVQAMVSSQQPIQRAVDEEGNVSFPEEERVDIDAMLDANGVENMELLTAAAYAHLQGLHAALVAAVVADADYDVSDDYYAILDYHTVHNLVAGAEQVDWNAGVAAGADHYEAANPANRTYALSAQATWPGRVAAAWPAGFTAAIQAMVAQREAARVAAINAAYQAYQANGRLLPITIVAIRQALGLGADLAAVQLRLTTVYERQCTISRQNWLIHLNIAARAINGNANLHYTTFNDAVTVGAGLRVDNNTVPQLCTHLFESVANFERLHATLVVGVNRYHKYWGGAYSANHAGMNAAQRIQLDGEYDRMIAEITARVTTAKANHGRVVLAAANFALPGFVVA